MSSLEWQVWIVDIERSRKIPLQTRSSVDRALHAAIRVTRKRFANHLRLPPQLLRGDEIQAVLRSDAPALTMLTYLRARFAALVGRSPALRCGIGTGAIARMSVKGPFESEGEAFHRARTAVERVGGRRGGRLTAWHTGRPEFDRAAEAVLPLVDTVVRRWTQAQWQAIAGRIEGKDLDRIAGESKVSFQAVSLRLRAASWLETQSVFQFLESLSQPGRNRGPGRPQALRLESNRSSLKA